MASINDEVKVNGVYGGVQTNTNQVNQMQGNQIQGNQAQSSSNVPVKRTFWSSMKAFWLQELSWNQKIDLNREIKVELTPYQQKVEDEVNDFLHQEITWQGFRNLLSFGKKDNK